MSGKGDVYENDLLKLVFNGTPIAGLADNASSSPLAYLYVSLHKSDPTDPGNQTSNECNYAGYARVQVARTSGGWIVTGNSVSPVANIDLPQCTSGADTATYFGVGTALTGSGKLLYSGPITPAVAIASGVVPRLTTASTITED